jgi:hypothetical protein
VLARTDALTAATAKAIISFRHVPEPPTPTKGTFAPFCGP